MMYLETKNAHPRDERIVFRESDHKYIVDGVQWKTSVSGFVHHFFPHFDSKGTINKNYEKWESNKDSKYYQLINYLKLCVGLRDKESIKAEISRSWTLNGETRSGYGTKVHRLIELHLNNEPIEEEPLEFKQYLKWRETHPTWVPYRTEWSVFNEDFNICGQIDSLWQDENGRFIMCDWKVVESLDQKSKFNEFGHEPFKDLHNTNYYHYIIQQNAYATLLKLSYGIEVSEMYLVQLHETRKESTELKLPNIEEKVLKAFEIFSRYLKGDCEGEKMSKVEKKTEQLSFFD